MEGSTPQEERSAGSAVPAREIARHSAATRLLHWATGLVFTAALAGGLGLLYPSVFGRLQWLFGGKQLTETLHPWFGLGFTALFALQFLNWLLRMRWTPADSAFVRALIRNAAAHPFGKSPPPAGDTPFFNGGQKAYFWSVAASAAIFLITGLVYWYKPLFWKKGVYLTDMYLSCRFVHRSFGVIMAVGLLVHVYKATLGEPGTLRSMIRGTVTEDWARTRRPGWFRELTGRR